jgi:hypothetical protein
MGIFYRIVTYTAKFKQLLQKLGSNGAKWLWMLYRDVLSLLFISYEEPYHACHEADMVTKCCQQKLASSGKRSIPYLHILRVFYEARLNAKLLISFSVFNTESQSKYCMHFISPHPSTYPVGCSVVDSTTLHIARGKRKAKTTSINAYWMWPWPLYGLCNDYPCRKTQVVTFLVCSSRKVAKMRPRHVALTSSFRLYFHLRNWRNDFSTFFYIKDLD